MKSLLLKYKPQLTFFFVFTLGFFLVKILFVYLLPFIIGVVVSLLMYPIYRFMKKRLSFKPAFSATVITLFIFSVVLSISKDLPFFNARTGKMTTVLTDVFVADGAGGSAANRSRGLLAPCTPRQGYHPCTRSATYNCIEQGCFRMRVEETKNSTTGTMKTIKIAAGKMYFPTAYFFVFPGCFASGWRQ